MIWSFYFFLLLCCNLKKCSMVSSFLTFDSNSVFMVSVSSLVFLLISSLAYCYFGEMEFLMHSICFLFILLLASFCFLVTSLFYFLVLLELTVTPMAVLILYLAKDADKVSSVLFMVLFNLMGSLPFMTFCYTGEGSGSLTSGSMFMIDSWWVWISFVAVLVCKLPFIFLHFWLTKAHVSASGACSMLLASVMLKLGSFGLLKFFPQFLRVSSLSSSFMLSSALLSILFFSAVMIRFFDLKYLVACSSILHMSLIFPLVLSGSNVGVTGSLMMMVGHGLISLVLFFLVTILYELFDSRSLDFNKSIESLAKPVSLFLFLFVFLNMGVPPFISFFSELFFLASLAKGAWSGCMVFWAGMLVSIIFVMIVCSKILFGKKCLQASSTNPGNIVTVSVSFLGFVSALVFLC